MGTDANNSIPDTNPATDDNKAGSKAGWLLLGAAAVLAAGSVGYNVYDGGGDDDAAIADADAPASIEDLRVAAEASDDDAGPWSELGFAYYERGEFAQSAQAYQRAVEIDPGEAVLWSALGESLAYAADSEDAAADPLPDDALAAFEKALELDPKDPRARYFFAVKQDLEGDHAGAISSWLALLSDTPPGAPWEESLVRTIQQVGAINDIDVEDRVATINSARAPEVMIPGSGAVAGDAASSALRGPTQVQIDEASRMTPGEQDDMVAGMVASLEARLADEPQNLDGWVMLMRSRVTLGETGKAREALANAVAANPDNADELRRQAAQLGIE